MNMNKRNVWIGVAVVAGLVLIFFVGRIFIGKQAGPSAEEQAKATLDHKRLTLHQVCRYADSVGIDTSRFASHTTDSESALANKLSRLLVEVRYGKKPSRLEYSGLKETIDSAWASEMDSTFSPALLQKTATFAPYNQLVGHYNRLRNRAKGNPATADSLRLIRQTLNFYRYTNRFDAEKFVLVNIPAAELNVFDRTGTRLLPMQVITGKADKRTPCMTTYITGIVAYPYWNVPRNIALEEMLPKMQRDISFIYNQNLQILDEKEKEVDPETIDWASLSATNFPYRIRQASGCENSLGLIKFELKNPLAIYLHDTNSRDLFTLTADRWRSHGCVRVQKPVELANLVLGKKTFDAGFMDRCLIDQKPKTLSIPSPVPVFITYNTADVDAAGKLRIYKDVYAMDK
jgi:L,D-transpeptidase YcbB